MTTLDVPSVLPEGLTHLSVSSLSTLAKCPEKWRRQYLERQYEPPSGKMILGSSAGAAETQHYAHVIEDGEGLTGEQVLDLFSDEWEERTSREDVDYGTDTPGALKDSGAAALGLYHSLIAPVTVPVSVEREFNVRFDECEWVLTGFLDLEEADGAVGDLKMRGKKPNPADAKSDPQPSAYLLARRAEGNPASSFRFHNSIRTKQPSAYVEETTRTDNQLDAFAARVLAGASEIEWRTRTDNWTGAPPMSWWCGERMCGYWSTCRFGGKR